MIKETKKKIKNLIVFSNNLNLYLKQKLTFRKLYFRQVF